MSKMERCPMTRSFWELWCGMSVFTMPGNIWALSKWAKQLRSVVYPHSPKRSEFSHRLERSAPFAVYPQRSMNINAECGVAFLAISFGFHVPFLPIVLLSCLTNRHGPQLLRSGARRAARSLPWRFFGVAFHSGSVHFKRGGLEACDILRTLSG